MKPNICLVSPGMLPVPPVKGGAIETLLQILAEENETERLLNITILSVYNPLAEQEAKKFRFTQFVFVKTDNVFERVINFIIKATNFLIRICFNKPDFLCTSYYIKCFRILRRENPDFIVAEGGDILKYRYLLPYFRKEQLYIHLHGHFIPRIETLDVFNGFIGVSQFITREFMKSVQQTTMKSYTVLNCINDDIFKKKISKTEYTMLREQLGFYLTDFIVLFCGRIVQIKGIRELIKAMNKIENDKIRLLVIGSPYFGQKKLSFYLHEIKNLVRKSKNKVVFIGYIEQEELYKYYQIADVLAVPSLCEEAFGLVVQEGLMSGLPLLVTDSGGVSEVVSSKAAIFMKRDEYLIENLASNIEFLYKNEEKRLSMAAAAIKESEKFSRGNYYQEFAAIFINN